jgi:hypothetical protein
LNLFFAPPAIAAAIGAYFHIFFPQIPVMAIAITAYIIFTGLNIYGVKAAAAFELVITVFARIRSLHATFARRRALLPPCSDMEGAKNHSAKCYFLMIGRGRLGRPLLVPFCKVMVFPFAIGSPAGPMAGPEETPCQPQRAIFCWVLAQPTCADSPYND